MKKEALIKFYTSYRLYIFPAVVALSSLILIIFIIFPQITKLIANKQTEGELINKSKFLGVKAQTLENLDVQDLSNKVNLSLSSYPSDKDFGTVIGLIQNLIIQSGFSVTTMSLGNQTSKLANSQAFNIHLDVSGAKNLIGLLLTNIENSTRLMRIGNIGISNTQDQISSVSLNLDVLYGPIPGSFGSVDSSLPELSEKDEQLLSKLAKNATPAISSSTNISLPSRGRANPFE